MGDVVLLGCGFESRGIQVGLSAVAIESGERDVTILQLTMRRAVALLGTLILLWSGAAWADAPAPLIAKGVPAQWVFVFKQNAKIFPSPEPVSRPCPFGSVTTHYKSPTSQQYIFASSTNPHLQDGLGLVGTSDQDPVGATFAQIYNGSLHFVVWNDQLKGHPSVPGCGVNCNSPWGHSKGILAWNDAGDGVVLQVTTPSWPGSGSHAHPRAGDGNTLGCVEDNDVEFSQHFFALKLTEADVEKLLDALANASVGTNVNDPELADIGGPAGIVERARRLGVKSTSKAVLDVTLSSGVRLIAKPSALNVPPWQLVSSALGGIDLRAATWWAFPSIPSTTRTSVIGCWDPSLVKPGAVDVAISGSWDQKVIGLKGGPSMDGNHAKIGISTSGARHYSIFGDMNQQGALSGKCDSSQNGRGGLFFVLDNADLAHDVGALIAGGSAPVAP